MPAAVWRTMPARSIRRCETICASAGVSRRVGEVHPPAERGGPPVLGRGVNAGLIFAPGRSRVFARPSAILAAAGDIGRRWQTPARAGKKAKPQEREPPGGAERPEIHPIW